MEEETSSRSAGQDVRAAVIEVPCRWIRLVLAEGGGSRLILADDNENKKKGPFRVLFGSARSLFQVILEEWYWVWPAWFWGHCDWGEETRYGVKLSGWRRVFLCGIFVGLLEVVSHFWSVGSSEGAIWHIAFEVTGRLVLKAFAVFCEAFFEGKKIRPGSAAERGFTFVIGD
jgi:hypothetical protein